MRPFSPLPRTLPRFTPSSRANLRTEGLACAAPKLCSSIGGKPPRAAGAMTCCTPCDVHLLHHAFGGRWNVHRGFVGLERDQRSLEIDGVARLHQHVDDSHGIETAHVGDADVDGTRS